VFADYLKQILHCLANSASASATFPELAGRHLIPPTIETKTPSEKTRHGTQTDVTAASVFKPTIPPTSRDFIHETRKRGPNPKMEDNDYDNDYDDIDFVEEDAQTYGGENF